jgi:hypothetical protein
MSTRERECLTEKAIYQSENNSPVFVIYNRWFGNECHEL